MASQNGDILLTIKSLFKGEGFTKADQAIKQTSKSAKNATETISKVTNALGGLNNEAGKVAGKLGGLFSSFAQGGVIGLAIAGVTTAFNFLSDKIEESKKKAEEAAKSIKKSFEDRLSKIKIGFDNTKSKNQNSILATESSTNLANSKLSPLQEQINRIKQEGKIRRAGMTDEKQRMKDQLAENLRVAEVQKSYTEQTYANNKKAEEERFNTADSTWKSAQKTFTDIKGQVDSRNQDLKNQLKERLKEIRLRFANVGDNADALERKNKAEIEAREIYIAGIAENNKILKTAKSNLDNEKTAWNNAQARYNNFKSQYNINTANAQSSIDIAKAEQSAYDKKVDEETKKGMTDFKSFLHSQKMKLEEDIAKRLSDTQSDITKSENSDARKRLEDEKDKKTKETVQQIDRLNQSIKKWEKAASDKARLYDRLGLNEGQGGNGEDIKDVLLGEGEDVRGRQNKLNRDRRNLLGKMDRARASGGKAWDDWQKNWQRLNGNPEKKLEDAQKTRDALQKQLADNVKDIAQKIKELGL